MEVLKDDFSELEIGNSVESFEKFLVSQKELFHSQIDELQKIVVKQCKLTGVNPLSQEMAAGALSIKIGKRPRDLLNPKAVNYMQSVFSIKDAISKKESREINALFGVTVTQVREFFTIQRSRVRRLVRSSKERATRSNSCEEPRDEFPTSSDPMRPINPTPLNSVGPASVEEVSSTQENALPDLDDLDKHFIDNIFSQMRKEETFSGQEKLMEWILKIQNSSVLCWFLSKGGGMILAAWLSEAAVEEQTSVLVLILKVLCHLPLHKALPVHMSAILQSVNRLRFYRTSDISNRARVLLSKWSKSLARNQALKKPNGVKASIVARNKLMLTESIGQIMGNESWHSDFDVPEDFLALSNEASDNSRKSEAPQDVKLLPAPPDDSNKKPALGVSSSYRERRKVQLVEQPGQKTVNRSPQATRAAPSQGRPMSADDIQKAKMRALFMQSKYGKTGSLRERKQPTPDGLHNKPLTDQASAVASPSKVPVLPKIEEEKKPLLLPSDSSKTSNKQEASIDLKLGMDLREPIWEKCTRVRIPWNTPAEVKLNDNWRLGSGENSKEVDVQRNRNRREKETIHQTVQEIPSNPKEPWDLEIDYDDTLTPEIPIEQLPDGDSAETIANNQEATAVATSSSNGNEIAAEPDLELLAVLLQNPRLVYALTSGQAGSLPSEETLKLLDMIKKGDVKLPGDLNGVSGNAQQNVDVSLPSPTPSTNPRTSGWSTEAAKNPFSRQSSMPDGIPHSSPATVITNLAQPLNPSAGIAVLQQPRNLLPFLYSLPQEATIVPERQLPSAFSSAHSSHLTNSPRIQTPTSDIGLNMKTIITANASAVKLSSAHSSLAMGVDGISNVKSIHNLSMQDGLSDPNSIPQSFVMPSPTPIPTPSLSATQPQRQHLILQQSHFSEASYHAPAHSYPQQIEKPNNLPLSDNWRARQDVSSNYHSQLNQNNSDAMFGVSVQSDSSWERNDYGGRGFESWSPENSPSRNHGYIPGRNLPQSRMDPGRNYRPESEWPRERGSSGYFNPSRQGNRKWHDWRQ
ncbi:hypothetical protein L6164_034654 [Bauhinia variegata]|uniref:Uncharacterized protein n=1 Tax=Bauhinia variegata TaxID=167791 RepID=A0ACB9KVM2_BAUVA|nr:hypothetical protein L6164_034654 [Bauhinia variegata]